MAQLFAGTSGWAYPSWKPDFYPQKLAQKKFLAHYTTMLNTVEVNFTFRQLVKETTIQNWLAESPAHFRFGVKAHQVITHIKRLKGTGDFVPRFLATIETRAGIISTSAESEGGFSTAQGFSRHASANGSCCVRIPA
jgi:uncharacterized protein YecE (DUF72 family)